MALPPGPTSPSILQLLRWLRAPFEFMRDCRDRFGETFTIRFPLVAASELVIFSNPEHVKQIFADDGNVMHAGKANAVLKPFVGENSVLILDGAAHMRQRKLLLPPFHGERMQAYGVQMLQITHDAIDRFNTAEPFALHPHTQQITLQVILRAVFGIDDAARMHRLTTLLERALRMASWPPMLFPIVQKDLGAWSPWGRFLRVADQVDQLLLSEIAARRPRDASERSDILSMLLRARDEHGDAMTDVELRDELITLLLAGHETTATALLWALRWILATPGLYDRLGREVRDTMEHGELVPERVARLELLDGVVKEALRLQPVIPMVGRVLQREATIGGYDLRAGSAALCSIYLVHRREDLYPDPERFDPSRYATFRPGPHEWIPFGGGIRRCIGAAFAVYEMKMVLAAIVSRTKMRLATRAPIREQRRHITLSPSDGLRIVVDEVDARQRGARAA